jgi:hypothetical protein
MTTRGDARRRIAFACAFALAIAGCSSGTPASSSTTAGQSVGASLSVPTNEPPSRPLASPSAARAGPAKLPVYHDGALRPIPAGTYTTTAPDGFFPGMTLTIPAGWSSREADNGELALQPDDRPDDTLLMWKDVRAVVTTNQKGTVGDVLDAVDSSADSLVKWMTSNPDMEILSKAKAATLGHEINGVQLTLTPSKTVNFADDECPDNPHCVAILRDPGHWGPEFYAIGGAGTSRLFVTTLPYPGEKHTFWVTLDAVNPADLSKFAAEAKPIIDSLGLPETYVAN